jgi:two-component system sensor histidine kinase PilS (NtrC family)
MSDFPDSSNKLSQHPDAYWRTMRYFSLYRLAIIFILIATYFLMNEREWWKYYDSPFYVRIVFGYLGFAGVMAAFAFTHWPRFNRQLTLQAMGDIGFIVMLMYASGGVKSGLGLLLVVAIAGASLISQGRLALFYAAMASIALLLEQTWQWLMWEEQYGDYSHAVMLGLSCFATAWLAHAFAKRTRQSEELASRRGVDLQNLAQINQLVIRDMLDGVVVVDDHQRLRHYNKRAETLLGVAGADWREAALSRFAPEVAKLHAEWMRSEQNTLRGDYRFSVNGKELRLRFLPVSPDRSGGTVIFIEDWSRVRTHARQLKLASLGRLTANIAHEIRNPLSAISHASQLLQEEENSDPASRRLLQIIDDNALRLDHMVQDILQLSRRDKAHQELLHLGAFLQEFHEQFCQVEKIDLGQFVLELEPDDMPVMFDRRHLHQVLWNLCRNGWRHGRKQAASLVLRLRAGTRMSEAEIEIADDGPGVSDEIRPYLFEPFFTTEANGTGLGLYVARELCEANGAGLDYVESRRGARFGIFIKRQYE